MRVVEYDDPDQAYAAAHEYLLSRPADHNLLHTILDQAREFSLGGRFWTVNHHGEVTGFALQSPRKMGVVLGRMDDHAIRALVDAIEPPVPGVQGAAASAALFAGSYTERNRLPTSHVEPQRLYELATLADVPAAPGAPRLAARTDRATLTEWMRAFSADLGESVPSTREAEQAVDWRIATERFWVWDHNGLASLTGFAGPAGGVARVGPVYTPPESRGAGYATACVHHVSRLHADRGLRCVLYTALSNPTSNAIYQRIGYNAIAEILTYRFAGR